MGREQIYISQLLGLLEEVRGIFPESDIQEAISMIDHEEWGVAYEIFCMQIFEYALPITRNYYKRLVHLGTAMKIDPSIWVPLEELIVDDNTEARNA